MTGSPYGRRAALTSFTWGEGELLAWPRGVVQALWVATTTETVPDFEVTLRDPEHKLEPTVLFELGRGILEARTGDPAIDERFRIVTDLPIIAPLLRPALERLADQRFVHLFHSGRAPGSAHVDRRRSRLSVRPAGGRRASVRSRAARLLAGRTTRAEETRAALTEPS